MTDFQIAPYCSERFEGVKSLWQEAFPDDPPWNAAEIAIPAKLAVQPDLFFVALDGDQVVGSIMAGYDGHRGWLYALAVLNSHRRRGVGAALVRGAEDSLRSAGCDKINLQVRSTNAAVVEF
jgi:ribosomal protein S18 acetylase RimI-like enzyme